MIVLVDMDGVLVDMVGGFNQRYKELFDIELDIEENTKYELRDSYRFQGMTTERENQIMYEPGFFLNLSPISGGKEALEMMKEMGFEVFICTSPKKNGALCAYEKYQWVETWLGGYWVDRMIPTRNKNLIFGDVLIDDEPEKRSGVVEPAWLHVLYDQPYNRHLDEKPRITWKTWPKIIQYANEFLKAK